MSRNPETATNALAENLYNFVQRCLFPPLLSSTHPLSFTPTPSQPLNLKMPQRHPPYYSPNTVHPPMATMTTRPNVPRAPIPPWAYLPARTLGSGYIAHNEHECDACHKWVQHYRCHLRAKEPSLDAACQERYNSVQNALNTVREAKNEEIADLRRKLEEAQRELEEVRQEKVSLRKGKVLGMLTMTCSASSSKSSSATLPLSPTHPARVSSHAAHLHAHPPPPPPPHTLTSPQRSLHPPPPPPPNIFTSPRGSLPHLEWPCQPALLQVHHASRER